jgi:carbon monoxide dehydrogenase subunit G
MVERTDERAGMGFCASGDDIGDQCYARGGAYAARNGLNCRHSADIVDISFNLVTYFARKALRLDFHYERIIKAPASVVWDALTDPAAMEPHLPGTAKVVAVSETEYRVSMKISMGFLRPTVNANIDLSNIVKPESFTIGLSGKSMGAGVTGTSEVVLNADQSNPNATSLSLRGSIETSGLLKKIKDSKIEKAATGFLESYFASVEKAASTG